MKVIETFALLAAVATAVADGGRDANAEMTVTATVVRPGAISTAMIREDVAVVAIKNSTGIDVLAEPGLVHHAGDTIIVTAPTRAGSITITLIY